VQRPSPIADEGKSITAFAHDAPGTLTSEKVPDQQRSAGTEGPCVEFDQSIDIDRFAAGSSAPNIFIAL
jgi:hypothetical protein